MTLLVHDGELADVCALLEELETPFTERQGELSEEDRGAPWALVIAPPRRILSLQLANADVQPVQIAILDHDARTLRTSLRRVGVRLMVRRPVHRATLRALIVHALYRGPEKRQNARVNVGAPIRYRTGWRPRSGILVDLSVGGCRVVLDQPIERGRAFALNIPAAISGGRSFTVKARVLSSGPHLGRPANHFVANACFEQVGQRQHERLKKTISLHVDGPAVFAAGMQSATPPARPSARPSGAPVASDATATPLAALRQTGAPCEAAEATAAAEPEPARAERRSSARYALDRRVVALGEQADRVLMGRDITAAGMRVDPNPLLEVGLDLDLAIHSERRDQPLVVRARVHRNDGDRGMILRFHELAPETSRVLNDVLDRLPLVDVDDGGRGCLVSEILATG